MTLCCYSCCGVMSSGNTLPLGDTPRPLDAGTHCVILWPLMTSPYHLGRWADLCARVSIMSLGLGAPGAHFPAVWPLQVS